MSDHLPVAERHSDLAALVRAAAAGDYKPVYLFTGEPFETKAAVQALLEVLVPESRRAFNLETYDGRTTATGQFIDSLRTPGFFPGVKVVWVRESPLFLSGEKRPDIAAALFGAWSEGRHQDAADKLLTLVALAGWTDEQFRQVRWPSLAKTRVREVFGGELDPDRLSQLEAVHAFCVSRDLRLGDYRDDSAVLVDFLDAGMPPQAVLLLTAAVIDARKRISKRVRELGAGLDCSVAHERSGALSRDAVAGLVRQVVSQFDKQLAPQAQDLILRRAGTDAAALAAEAEKLCLYVGARAAITADDVRAAFRDMAESWIFDFTSALAARQLSQTLLLLRGLFAQGEPPLRLLAMVAREVRLLLTARECLDQTFAGRWRPDTPFNVFQARLLPSIDPATREVFGAAHPFVLYRRFQDSARIPAGVMRRALTHLSDLDIRMKSSRGDPAMLLEAFILDWCRPGSRARQPAGAA